MSDYRIFWNNERWKLYAKYYKHNDLFHMQIQNGANGISEMVNIYPGFFVKNIQIYGYLKSSDFVQILPACAKNS